MSGIFKNLISYIENTTYFIKKTPGITLKPAPRSPALAEGIKIVTIKEKYVEKINIYPNRKGWNEKGGL